MGITVKCSCYFNTIWPITIPMFLRARQIAACMPTQEQMMHDSHLSCVLRDLSISSFHLWWPMSRVDLTLELRDLEQRQLCHNSGHHHGGSYASHW